LCRVAPRIKVLSRMSWPDAVIDAFLVSWRRGEPELPVVEYPAKGVFADAIVELERIRDASDPTVPLEAYIRRTADSYADACHMLEAAGTPRFLEISRRLYGDPNELLPGSGYTHFQAARQLLQTTAPLRAACEDEQALRCITAASVRDELQRRTDPFFGTHRLEIVVDSKLAAKAAAAARRIRIRAKTSFTEADIEQLLEHEAFVHSATALNGQLQRVQSLSLAAPRTTGTQEGLATVAELVTGSMDLSRLRRLALRIGAVKHVIDGADFVEVFRFFLRAGQGEEESARSAMRVFRGGDVKGGVAFTKDVVYLHGLIAVHTFLRLAIYEKRVELIPRLFAGRVTLSDILALEPAFDADDLLPGRYVAPWASDPRRLAATLCFSLVVSRIDLEEMTLSALLSEK
jgi:uncharacterized protein (TIGR02421 family)